MLSSFALHCGAGAFGGRVQTKESRAGQVQVGHRVVGRVGE